MGTARENNQFSIAGLLFLTVGVALFCSAIPYLSAVSSMSPPWSVFAAIILMFAWAMIALRKGASRAWWIGFVAAGIVYLSIALVAVPKSVLWLQEATHDANGQVLPAWKPLFATASFEQIAVFVVLTVTLVLLVLLGVAGGYIAKTLYQRSTNRQSSDPNTEPSKRSALP